MHVADLLSKLRVRGVVLCPTPDGIRYEAPRGALTPELRAAIAEHKSELLTLLVEKAGPAVPAFDVGAGELAAVKLRGTIIGDLWLVADADAMAENPDIIRSGLPVVFFDEVERLRGKTAAELRAIGLVKAAFPTGRVLQ